MDATVAEAQKDIIERTGNLFNNILTNQQTFFGNIKNYLPLNSQRSKDIQKYIDHMEKIKQEKDVNEKEKMWTSASEEVSLKNKIFYI